MKPTKKNPPQQPDPPPATATDSKGDVLNLVGPVTLGLSLGFQLMTTAFMIWGPVKNSKFVEQLTPYGRSVTVPEREYGLFVMGLAFSLVLVILIERWWRGIRAGILAEARGKIETLGASLQIIAGSVSMLLYLILLSSRFGGPGRSGVREPSGPLDVYTLLMPAVMAMVWIYFDLRRAGATAGAEPGRWRNVANRILLWVTPVFVILAIGVPKASWTDLAGQFFVVEWMHSINFFIMGPAICYSHGMAFGSEFYSQYGIGWALLLAKLGNGGVLTFGSIVGLEVVCACLYYIGLFFVLRACFKQEIWAAIGVIFAFYLQLFSGLDTNHFIWMFPSSTLMRHPWDVAFFFMLWQHRRSGKMLWLALAGIANAVAIFFETETGGYLVVTFFIYWVLQAGVAVAEGRPAGRRGLGLPPVVFYGFALGTLLPLLFVASRGTLFSRAFWHGWIEALVQYGSWGVGGLPIGALGNDSIIFFLIRLAAYVGVIGWVVLKCLRREAGKNEVLLATVAAYGLALSLVFVNRSHPYNLYHPAVPFAVVLTALVFTCRKAVVDLLPRSALPGVIITGLLWLLLTKAQFQNYPSLLKACFKSTPHTGLTLTTNPTDITGLPDGSAEFIKEFTSVVAAVKSLNSGADAVAILDFNDTPLTAAANISPWSRYPSSFHMALTTQAIEDLRTNLTDRPPKYVVIRGEKLPRPQQWEFVWSPLYQVVKANFALQQTVGAYEIWKLKTAAP